MPVPVSFLCFNHKLRKWLISRLIPNWPTHEEALWVENVWTCITCTDLDSNQVSGGNSPEGIHVAKVTIHSLLNLLTLCSYLWKQLVQWCRSHGSQQDKLSAGKCLIDLHPRIMMRGNQLCRSTRNQTPIKSLPCLTADAHSKLNLKKHIENNKASHHDLITSHDNVSFIGTMFSTAWKGKEVAARSVYTEWLTLDYHDNKPQKDWVSQFV